MWTRLQAVVEEQAQVLIRTAFSPIVRECGDISAGIFDTAGRMLAQAVTGTPGHINTMAASVELMLDHFPLSTMRPGDYRNEMRLDGYDFESAKRWMSRRTSHEVWSAGKRPSAATESCSTRTDSVDENAMRARRRAGVRQ